MIDLARTIFGIPTKRTGKSAEQNLEDDAVVRARAEAALDVAVAEELSGIDQAFVNSLNSVAADTGDLTSAEIETLLVALEDIESTGKTAGKLKALDRQRRVNSDVAELKTAASTNFFGNEVDPAQSETSHLAGRAAARGCTTPNCQASGVMKAKVIRARGHSLRPVNHPAPSNPRASRNSNPCPSRPASPMKFTAPMAKRKGSQTSAEMTLAAKGESKFSLKGCLLAVRACCLLILFSVGV